jgi:hypothetical protein
MRGPIDVRITRPMDNKCHITLRELRLLFATLPGGHVTCAWMIADSDEARLRAVDAAIDWIVAEHSKNLTGDVAFTLLPHVACTRFG